MGPQSAVNIMRGRNQSCISIEAGPSVNRASGCEIGSGGDGDRTRDLFWIDVLAVASVAIGSPDCSCGWSTVCTKSRTAKSTPFSESQLTFMALAGPLT